MEINVNDGLDLDDNILSQYLELAEDYGGDLLLSQTLDEYETTPQFDLFADELFNVNVDGVGVSDSAGRPVPVTLKCEEKTSRFSKPVDSPTINALQEQMESQNTKKNTRWAYKIWDDWHTNRNSTALAIHQVG
jgi:hypothetical protein